MSLFIIAESSRLAFSFHLQHSLRHIRPFILRVSSLSCSLFFFPFFPAFLVFSISLSLSLSLTHSLSLALDSPRRYRRNKVSIPTTRITLQLTDSLSFSSSVVVIQINRIPEHATESLAIRLSAIAACRCLLQIYGDSPICTTAGHNKSDFSSNREIPRRVNCSATSQLPLSPHLTARIVPSSSSDLYLPPPEEIFQSRSSSSVLHLLLLHDSNEVPDTTSSSGTTSREPARARENPGNVADEMSLHLRELSRRVQRPRHDPFVSDRVVGRAKHRGPKWLSATIRKVNFYDAARLSREAPTFRR